MFQLMYLHWGFVARILKLPGFTLAHDNTKGRRRSTGNR
jgi:hypothetical protein